MIEEEEFDKRLETVLAENEIPECENQDCSPDVKVEVYKNLKKMENKEKIGDYWQNHCVISPTEFTTICDWMIRFCIMTKRELVTYVRAVSLLEHFYNVAEDADVISHEFVALSCILLSSKLQDETQITADHCQQYFKGEGKEKFLEIEIRVYNTLKMKIHYVIILDYVEIYLACVISSKEIFASMKSELHGLTILYALFITSSYRHKVDKPPSICAAIAVAYACYTLLGYVFWPLTLSELLGIGFGEILDGADQFTDFLKEYAIYGNKSIQMYFRKLGYEKLLINYMIPTKSMTQDLTDVIEARYNKREREETGNSDDEIDGSDNDAKRQTLDD